MEENRKDLSQFFVLLPELPHQKFRIKRRRGKGAQKWRFLPKANRMETPKRRKNEHGIGRLSCGGNRNRPCASGAVGVHVRRSRQGNSRGGRGRGNSSRILQILRRRARSAPVSDFQHQAREFPGAPALLCLSDSSCRAIDSRAACAYNSIAS